MEFLTRFIPAWAGNTLPGAVLGLHRPVHPRVGGEHTASPNSRFGHAGSSPRGRGTHIQPRMPMRRNRFIPAWAGNTPSTWAPSSRSAVHPRVGGEHEELSTPACRGVGSSPRGRGTLGEDPGCVEGLRFIPAWAGNTLDSHPSAACTSVHPRVGGEHSVTISRTRRTTGSSPRGRGTPVAWIKHRIASRFIPAWAGNTLELRRGIHGSTGSSPRGRGTHARLGWRILLWRFIPAWAGNTLHREISFSFHPVHPRVGGEHPSFRVDRYP